MGLAENFEKEKLIIGVIYHEPEKLKAALNVLTEKFGEVDAVSEEFSFSTDFSTYYDEEIGGEGFRRIYSFKNTVDPARQADIKIRTNEIEAELSVDGKRRINLDPGFINHGRLLLATTKETGFRIPLKDGIYTDYQSERVQKFITEVRRTYLADRRKNITKQ